MRYLFPTMVLLFFLAVSPVARAQPKHVANAQPCGVVLICSETIGSHEPTNLIDIMEHLGLVYQIVSPKDLANITLSNFQLAVVDSSTELERHQERTIVDALSDGVDVIWIGGRIRGYDDKTLPEAFGIRYIREGKAEEFNISYVGNDQRRTKIFSEALTQVELVNASAIAYFIDNNGSRVFPAETFYRGSRTSGKAYFFSYEVHAWWKADSESPWMRARELHRALVDCVFDGFSVTLLPYPRNMQMAFICRIEDVTPIHTSEEWLARANDYLHYYSSKRAPLSVSLIPLYADPNQNLTVPLNATSANDLRQWLFKALERRGRIIQHGYTHQRGMSRSGVASEFYDEQQKYWLSTAEQQRLIDLGKKDIYDSLRVEAKVFEAAHYKANDDTYSALAISGFEYTTHDTNTPFFHRFTPYKETQTFQETYIINIPETLEYIPLDPPSNFENALQTRIDDLHEIGGVALFFNHLYDDAASSIGKNLLDYSLKKKGVWPTTVEDLGKFWKQRWNAYESFKVSKNSTITVTLGKSMESGLTLKLTGQNEISKVHVNGKPWTLFGRDYVILPELPYSLNKVEIDTSPSQTGNPVSEIGIALISLSIIVSFCLTQRAFRSRRRVALKDIAVTRAG